LKIGITFVDLNLEINSPFLNDRLNKYYSASRVRFRLKAQSSVPTLRFGFRSKILLISRRARCNWSEKERIAAVCFATPNIWSLVSCSSIAKFLAMLTKCALDLCYFRYVGYTLVNFKASWSCL